MSLILPNHQKIGVIVPDWDALRRDEAAYQSFIEALKTQVQDRGVIVLSLKETNSSPVLLRDHIKRAYLTDIHTLSPARLARLCDGNIFNLYGKKLVRQTLPAPSVAIEPRFGFIVSNGFGLGHVTRMRAIAAGLTGYGAQSFMSFSGGLTQDAFYLPSQQYLCLDEMDGFVYTREATLRFFNHTRPTHVFYDGNSVPAGILAALAHYPDVHLTWIRRGMWPAHAASKYMAGQALVDLVIEPGEFAESYDNGPSWNNRLDYCPPCAFLKTPPIKALSEPPMKREDALAELGLDPRHKHALLMLGANQKSEDMATLNAVIDEVRKVPGMTPVIAHWPISHDKPPKLPYALTIERMPIARFYPAFDVILSAAGYNSFHELIAAGYPVIFIPQEDEGRDQQYARARYAADRNLAQVCRRTELAKLHTLIPQSHAHAGAELDWLEDYSLIGEALNIIPALTQAIKPRRTLPDAKRMKAFYRGWKRRHNTYKNTFIMAIDMDTDEFFKKIKKTPKDKTIIVTDTVDPMRLRRAGYKYVWINSKMLGPYALRRQFLVWLKIWKPYKLRDLNSLFG